MVEDEKKIIDEIKKQRRLPYSLEILEKDGDRYTVRNNFGSTLVYVKKGNTYILEDE